MRRYALATIENKGAPRLCALRKTLLFIFCNIIYINVFNYIIGRIPDREPSKCRF
jgi:hypothetical protein